MHATLAGFCTQTYELINYWDLLQRLAKHVFCAEGQLNSSVKSDFQLGCDSAMSREYAQLPSSEDACQTVKRLTVRCSPSLLISHLVSCEH